MHNQLVAFVRATAELDYYGSCGSSSQGIQVAVLHTDSSGTFRTGMAKNAGAVDGTSPHKADVIRAWQRHPRALASPSQRHTWSA